MIEFAQVKDVLTVGLALWSVFRVEMVRRSNKAEEFQKQWAENIAVLQKQINLEGSILREKQQMLDLKQAIMDARMKPILDDLDKRVAMTFHQPHSWAARLDALIEEYTANADTMAIPRMQALIDEAYAILQHSSKDGEEPDPSLYLRTGIWLSFMDGRRDARPLEIEYAFRARELEAKQRALEAERERLRVEPTALMPPQEKLPWWTRWWRWVNRYPGGSK